MSNIISPAARIPSDRYTTKVCFNLPVDLRTVLLEVSSRGVTHPSQGRTPRSRASCYAQPKYHTQLAKLNFDRNLPEVEKQTNRQTHRQTHTQTDRRTDTQTDDKQTNTQTQPIPTKRTNKIPATKNEHPLDNKITNAIATICFLSNSQLIY